MGQHIGHSILLKADEKLPKWKTGKEGRQTLCSLAIGRAVSKKIATLAEWMQCADLRFLKRNLWYLREEKFVVCNFRCKPTQGYLQRCVWKCVWAHALRRLCLDILLTLSEVQDKASWHKLGLSLRWHTCNVWCKRSSKAYATFSSFQCVIKPNVFEAIIAEKEHVKAYECLGTKKKKTYPAKDLNPGLLHGRQLL